MSCAQANSLFHKESVCMLALHDIASKANRDNINVFLIVFIKMLLFFLAVRYTHKVYTVLLLHVIDHEIVFLFD